MPQSAPSGGLSLIIHILVNVIVFAYNKLLKITGLSNKNLISNSFEKLTNKEGDTPARHLLSYLLVTSILIVMSSNFILLTVKLYKLKDVRISSKIEEVITSKYAGAFSDDENDTANNEVIGFSTLSLESAEIDPLNSLIDFMQNLGMVNTSFESRADLAKELGVVNAVGEYTSSSDQNREMVRKLQEESGLKSE